jgi:hypothetical protein
MKNNSKFFYGLAVGLLFSFITFAVGTLQSDNKTVPVIQDLNASNSGLEGEFITTEEADQMINNFSTFSSSCNTTIGGFIGKSNLRSVTGLGANSLIKYRLYVEQDPEGKNKIGLLFYKDKDATSVLKTGAASFCPVVCDYPDDN